MILDSYENQNELNGKLRNKLSHLIISHSLKESIEKKISQEKFGLLSQAISILFPNENKETYYTPYKKESTRVTPARGKLWDKYCNMRKEFRNNTNVSKPLINDKNELVLNNEGILNTVFFYDSYIYNIHIILLITKIILLA